MEPGGGAGGPLSSLTFTKSKALSSVREFCKRPLTRDIGGEFVPSVKWHVPGQLRANGIRPRLNADDCENR